MSDSSDPMDCSLPPPSMGFSRQKYWFRLRFSHNEMDVKGDQEGANEGRRQKRQSRGALLCLVDKDSQDLGGSCLENSRDRGAWWAAVYGVAQSRTRLK